MRGHLDSGSSRATRRWPCATTATRRTASPTSGSSKASTASITPRVHSGHLSRKPAHPWLQRRHSAGNCLECHTTAVSMIERAGESDDGLNCVACHGNVGHATSPTAHDPHCPHCDATVAACTHRCPVDSIRNYTKRGQNERAILIENKKSRKHIGFMWWPLVVAALSTGVVLALLSNIQGKQEEAKQYPLKVVEISENELDPAVWGLNFPVQYDYVAVEQVRTHYGGASAPPTVARSRTASWSRSSA